MPDWKLPSICLYVQHLLGVGHIYRTMRLASAFAGAGCRTTVLWGGERIAALEFGGVDVIHLPPVKVADAGFSELLHPDGTPFGKTDRTNRCRTLLTAFGDCDPDILITETFPFGRALMQFELLPLLDLASAGRDRLIVASVRDILQEGRREKRVRESLRFFEAYYDLLLVHGDPELVRIEHTLQGADEILDKVRYGGIIGPAGQGEETRNMNPATNVLVSSGGGAFGEELIRTAVAAASIRPDTQAWTIIAGQNLPQTVFDELCANVPPTVRMVRQVPDLVTLMRGAGVSVSHSGYNTVADILVAGVKPVLVPHTGGRETEQLRRAEILAGRNLAVMVDPERLNPETLNAAIAQAQNLPMPQHTYRVDGGEAAVRLLIAEWQEQETVS